MASPITGTHVYKGQRAAYITANGTTQVLAGRGRACRLVVSSAGVGWTLDVYDDVAGTSNRIWSYASADGKVSVELDVPLALGLKVVAAGTTPGSAVITYTA